MNTPSRAAAIATLWSLALSCTPDPSVPIAQEGGVFPSCDAPDLEGAACSSKVESCTRLGTCEDATQYQSAICRCADGRVACAPIAYAKDPCKGHYSDTGAPPPDAGADSAVVDTGIDSPPSDTGIDSPD